MKARVTPASIRLFLITTLAFCSAAAASSCTYQKEEDHGMRASELCDSSLTEEAAKKAEELSGEIFFEEDKHRPLVEVATDLKKHEGHFGSHTGNTCRTYASKDGSGAPFFEISFSREKEEGVSSRSDFFEHGKAGSLLFPIGRYAASGENGGNISFSCAKVFSREEPSVIFGSIFSPSSYVSSEEEGRSAMTILLSVSRAVAEELGCLEEANLPEKLPEPSATWTPPR